WTREPQLLALAKQNMPTLPVEDLDVLIVDRFGKNISGTGMDTNIIGRTHIFGEPEPVSPRINMIVVTDLTDESHGNATGMGFADIVTRRLYRKIDFPVTYKNVVTAGFPDRAKLPMVMETDREALDLALRGAGRRDPALARVARIRDTLHLGEMLVSAAVADEVRNQPHIDLISGPQAPCDANGTLIAF